MLVNYIVYPRESEKATNVTNKLETIFSVEDEVFSVLNETNISFPLDRRNSAGEKISL